MTLPTYDKSKRRSGSFQPLPKGAYVVKILNAKKAEWPSGDEYIKIFFDIAEGEYKDFYRKQYDANTKEDKVWPYDAAYSLNVPNDSSKPYVWDNWNTFFADLEDSNNGFVFKGDLKTLTGKLIGGKFRIRQSESKGNVYDHTELYYTCIADAVRNNTYGKMPKDKLIEAATTTSTPSDPDGFMSIPADSPEEIPFD